MRMGTFMTALLGGLSAACTGATTGDPIARYADARTALLVVDLQRDFLADDGRLPIEREQRASVIAASSSLLRAAEEQKLEVVYIGNEFSKSDLVANWFRRDAALAGSRGAEKDPRVPQVGDVYFPKAARDAFTNPALDEHLRRAHVGRLVIVGVKADACVRATALAALNRGYEVTLVREGVGADSKASRDGALTWLADKGARVLGVDEAVAELH